MGGGGRLFDIPRFLRLAAIPLLRPGKVERGRECRRRRRDGEREGGGADGPCRGCATPVGGFPLRPLLRMRASRSRRRTSTPLPSDPRLSTNHVHASAATGSAARGFFRDGLSLPLCCPRVKMECYNVCLRQLGRGLSSCCHGGRGTGGGGVRQRECMSAARSSFYSWARGPGW